MTLTTLLYMPGLADRYAAALSAAGHTDPVLVAQDQAQLAALLPQADIAVGWNFPPGSLARHGQHLRWLQNMAAGVDTLLADELPAGLVVSRLVDHFGPVMSEYALGMLLAHSQRLHRAWEQQQARRWRQYRTRSWAGRLLGVAGIGEIGLATARLAQALGMRVRGLARTPGPRPQLDEVYTSAERLAFCQGLDALVVVLPLTPATRGLFGAAELAALRPGAYLVNMGRGPLVDEAALLAAIQAGRLSGAALDVFDEEPLPPDHAFWTTPGVTVTPHVAGITDPDGACRQFRENYRRLLAGEPLLGVVDRERGY